MRRVSVLLVFSTVNVLVLIMESRTFLTRQTYFSRLLERLRYTHNIQVPPSKSEKMNGTDLHSIVGMSLKDRYMFNLENKVQELEKQLSEAHREIKVKNEVREKTVNQYLSLCLKGSHFFLSATSMIRILNQSNHLKLSRYF